MKVNGVVGKVVEDSDGWLEDGDCDGELMEGSCEEVLLGKAVGTDGSAVGMLLEGMTVLLMLGFMDGSGIG